MEKQRIRLCCVFLLFIGLIFSPIHLAYAEDSHYIQGVPLSDQGNKPWCGPGCIVMILQYWNIEVTMDEVGEEIDPEEDGCYESELVEYLEGIYIEVYEFDTMDDLKYWICKDHPVIVCQWWDETKEEGHFRLVVGYDSEYVYINDPNGFKTKVTYETFFLLWTMDNEYGMTISPVKQFVTDPYTNRSVRVN